MKTVESEGLAFTDGEGLSDYLGRTDVVVFVCAEDTLELPQFGLRVDIETADEAGLADAMSRLVKQLVAHYVALSELDDDFIHEQERGQLTALNGTFVPWFMRQMASNPNYFEVPPINVRRHGRDGHGHLSRA